jgi:hypothetical protein
VATAFCGKTSIGRSALDPWSDSGHNAFVAEIAHLRVERAADGYRDRLRSYAVILDGREAGRVKRGQAIEIDISPGAHVAMVKLDWCSSPQLTFSVSPGEVVVLACRPGGALLSAPWHFLFARGGYIAIDRIE